MTSTVFALLLQLILLAPSWAAVPAETAAPAPAAAVQARKTPSQEFARLAEDYWETLMRLSPLWATFVNHPGDHDRLDDISAEGRKAEVRELSGILGRLKAIERRTLSESERVSWDIMKLQIDLRLEAQRHKFYQWDVDHMDGPSSWIPSVIELAQPMKSAEDARALLARLNAMPLYFSNQIGNLREGMKAGRVAARIPVEKAIRQLEELLKAPPEQTPYAEAGKRLPLALKGRYLPKIVAAVKNEVYPAYERYLKFLKEEYRTKARTEKIGLGALPGGNEAYRFKIRYHTTLDKSPEELNDSGLEELKSIHAEMEAIAGKMGHGGDLNSFLEKIRRDPKNFFETREEVLRTAEVLVASASAKLPQFFGTLPKTSLVVKPIEEYKEKNDVAARYYPPPNDLSRPGIYYINTYEPKTRPRFSMTSLTAHESVPGHHLQIALALEQKDLPTFRRQADFTAYVEGWALYTERLAEEMGLYADDLSRAGMLSDQALRASRLVVDTGIHAMGWSRRQAIDFMKANTPMSEEEIVAEVDRYTIWPGQALAYKVGQREIMNLRRQFQAVRKDPSDLRAFHDAVLKNGAVPLTILREAVLGPQAQKASLK